MRIQTLYFAGPATISLCEFTVKGELTKTIIKTENGSCDSPNVHWTVGMAIAMATLANLLRQPSDAHTAALKIWGR